MICNDNTDKIIDIQNYNFFLITFIFYNFFKCHTFSAKFFFLHEKDHKFQKLENKIDIFTKRIIFLLREIFQINCIFYVLSCVHPDSLRYVWPFSIQIQSPQPDPHFNMLSGWLLLMWDTNWAIHCAWNM